MIPRIIKRFTPLFIKRWGYALGLKRRPKPAEQLRLGDFDRTTPFSTCFGYDRRGGPVDRFYIESFLEKNASAIKGRVLEIGDNSYTRQFGGAKVVKSDILHVDASNPDATYIGNLSDAHHIESGIFDCIILTQTLHLIYHYKDAIATCHRILKEGGCLLLTVPGISQIDHGEWKQTWLWSFTSHSVEKILGEVFHKEKTDIETFGNVFIASAFLYGLGLKEVPQEHLNAHDEHYQVIIAAKAVK